MSRKLAILALVASATACESQSTRMDAETIARLMTTYYDNVDASAPGVLRSTLHDTIDDHTRYPFSSTAVDTWDILEAADEDPNDANAILDVYRNESYPKVGGGTGGYNREHTWPSSFGFPNDNASNYPYSDTHALFLSDAGYNSARSNKPFRECDASCSENPTVANNGAGGGSGVYLGNSNWRTGPNATGTWETWIGRRGDVARALMYLDVRYEGGSHGVTSVAEPDLVLTDDQALITASNTGSNESIAYMGDRSVLLRWHIEDPVDGLELTRNAVVFGFQGNRNPFIDHPEWVACAFSNTCNDTTAPTAPTALSATAGNGVVDLDWADHADPGLIGYFVYRATTAGGPYTRVQGSMATASAYADGGVQNGTTYYYVVTAVDVAGNESSNSAEVSASPSTGGGGSGVWINEFHYDNTGSDTGEFVEVAGAAGTDLSGWTVVGYNGSNGAPYRTIGLSGTIADQGGCTGTIDVDFSSMQNGSPDGLALVDDAGVVREFISYEGAIVATSGPASGTTSTDIGVSEPTSTPVGHSLQLSGSGASAGDFAWQSAAANTRGLPNNGQTFTGCSSGCTTNAECDDGVFCNGAETCVASACQAGTAVSCDDGVACTADSCNETTDACDNVPDDLVCDDGAFCNGAETCDAVLGCQGGADPCAGQSCDEGTNQCVGCLTNAECDDGLFCNGAETCSGGACVAGTAVDCTALADQCNAGVCDEPTDACVQSPLASGTSCDDGDACTAPDQCDGAGSCAPGGDVCGGGGPNLQTVTVTTNGAWTVVNVGASYTSMVVVCTPSYGASQGPTVLRMRNASGSSFEIAAVLVDGSGSFVSGIDAYCMVVEAGVYTQAADGVTMEAVRYDSIVTDYKQSWAGEQRTYANTYASPVVLGQVMTANDPDWSVFWTRGSGRTSPPSASTLWTGKHVGEDPDTARATETIGYVVIDAGTGAIDGRSYRAALGADTVRGHGNAPPYTYSVSGLSSATAAILTQAAMDGADGSWAFHYGPFSATSLSIAVDEDQLSNGERRHTTEQVGYIVFE